jgi:carboxyl-terminal processing protease
VQTIIPLGSGNGALALTTSRFYTPSGKSIEATGLVPDVEVQDRVSSNDKSDDALQTAISLLEGTASSAAFPANSKAKAPSATQPDAIKQLSEPKASSPAAAGPPIAKTGH